MRPILTALALALALTGCAALATPPAPVMPQTAQGSPAMNQNEAIALASWALSDPATTRGNPERAARAVAAAEWLAGQTQLTGDFGQYAPANEVSWYELRRQLRGAIGIPATAPAQEVVNRLIATADALKAGQTGAADAQLQPPVFSLGPDRTLAVLSALPPFSEEQTAFYELDRNENRSLGNCGFNPNC